VRIHAEGRAGAGELAVPVPSLPARTEGMQRAFGALLLGLLLLLGGAVVSIVGASAREALLPPGVEPAAIHQRRGRVAMAVTCAIVAVMLIGGNAWWNAEAADYAEYVYKPLAMDASLEGGRLTLALCDPGWLRSRRVDDLLP